VSLTDRESGSKTQDKNKNKQPREEKRRGRMGGKKG
jgi:hypothetical protein